MSEFFANMTVEEKQRLTRDSGGSSSFTDSVRSSNPRSSLGPPLSPASTTPLMKCKRVIVDIGNAKSKQGHRCTLDCLTRYPIHHAARMGKYKVLKQLLDQYTQGQCGDAATTQETAPDIPVLPRVCCPLEQDECFGRTPLHYAASAGHVEKGLICTKLLLECSALQVDAEKRTEKLRRFVNAVDYNNESALHLAAKNEATKIVRELLMNQADLDIRSADGKCALMEVYKKTPLAMNEALSQSITFEEFCKRDMCAEDDDDVLKRKKSDNSDEIDFTQAYSGICLNF